MEDKDRIEGLCFYKTKCRVCNSVHRAEMERMKLEGKSLRDIIEFSEKEWNEKHSLSSLSSHFTTHLLPLILAQSKSTRVAKEYADKRLEVSMGLLSELEGNLTILKRGIDLLISKGLDTPPKVSMLKTLLSEVRLTVETIANLRHSLDLTLPTEHADNVKTLLSILKKLNLNEAQLLTLQKLMKEQGITDGESSKPSNSI